ncbi:hypothetical protein [Acrocarpospora pleiomorpha]|uniref:hypothetical protein n=1 Tax=Acrocarpospora pleiomorpha TaxID=90975 RepID=UPI0012D3024A|nr:hypothetical protein [Acrocarpospora pleiomorpha]
MNRATRGRVVQNGKRIVPVLLLAAGCGVVRPWAAEPAYACGNNPVPLEVLSDGRPATQLGPDGRAALKGHEVRPVEDLHKWRIVEESDERVAIIRELDEPRDPDTMKTTHGYLLVERFGPPDADGRPSWHLRSSRRCDLRRVMDGLGVADVALDPARPATGTGVHLLVTERACASGQPATGRVRVVSLEETDREVGLVIGVERFDGGGAVTCQGNPPTPFTVELGQPLGDRVLRDAGVHPTREIVEFRRSAR